MSSRKVGLFLSDFKDTSFLDRFLKDTQISKFIQILTVGAEILHADGRTAGHDEAKSRFSQFCESA